MRKDQHYIIIAIEKGSNNETISFLSESNNCIFPTRTLQKAIIFPTVQQATKFISHKRKFAKALNNFNLYINKLNFITENKIEINEIP